MGNILEPTKKMEREWIAWCNTRPDHVKAVALKFRPWKLYRINSSGHRVTLFSFGEGEDGSVTLRVNVTGEYNFVMFDRLVFGIKPGDLEECDLPAPEDTNGTMLTEPADVDAFIDAARPHVPASRKP